MDSRDNPQPPPHPQIPNMMVGPGSYPTSHMIGNPNSVSAASANPNPATSSMMMHLHHHHGHPHHQHHQQQQQHQHQQQQQQHQQHQQHQQQQQQPRFPFAGPPSSEPLDSLAATTGLYDGSSPSGFSIEPAKKKRGRPRKYAPEGNIALGLGPASTPPSSGAAPGSPSTEPSSKKNRGRPPGSGKKQMDALGAGGIGFTPHVIMVKAGEDIASKIVAFSQEGPRTVCILSANGAVSNVSLKQPSIPGPAANYEGRYEIISLSGSFEFSDGGTINHSRIGGLSVSLAGPDGRVVGGGVAGVLIAATPVQVIVGSFLTGNKKSSSKAMKSGPSSAPQSQTLNFGAPQAIVSPPSQDGSSESSGENGNGGSPMPRSSGYYNEVSQPVQGHGIHMYHHLWAGQTHR